MDVVDQWIEASDVRGSFTDIGGIGENSTNERVTFAVHCGYENICIADLEGEDHHLWKHFKSEINDHNKNKIHYKYNLNVDDTSSMKDFGQWDMVHSTGIMYHVPNPMHTLKNYKIITRKELIINTVIVPELISNSRGSINFGSCSALFMPSLCGNEREIMREHYRSKFGWDLNNVSPLSDSKDNIMPYLSNGGEYSYYPYWWLFTEKSFQAALELLQMKVVDAWTWEGHAHFVWLRVDG